MTSIASSASEARSVCFGGAEMSLEQALDTVVRSAQACLNDLQLNLRQLAALEDQEIDEDEDFQAAVDLEDRTVDLVELLGNQLRELIPIAADIRGSCPKSSREWYSKHKMDRKDAAKQAKERERMAAAAARAKTPVLA